MQLHNFGSNDFAITELSLAELVTIIAALGACAQDVDCEMMAAELKLELFW